MTALVRSEDGWVEQWVWTAPDLLGSQFVGNEQIAAADESGRLVMLDAQGQPRLEQELAPPAVTDFAVDRSGRFAIGVSHGGKS